MSTQSTTSTLVDVSGVADYVAGLRELADHLEQHPELVPTWGNIRVNLFADDAEQFSRLVSELGGRREKEPDDHYMSVTRSFGPHVIDVNIERERVCRRVVTGTRVVPAQPAQEERVEELVEWVCDDPILSRL